MNLLSIWAILSSEITNSMSRLLYLNSIGLSESFPGPWLFPGNIKILISGLVRVCTNPATSFCRYFSLCHWRRRTRLSGHFRLCDDWNPTSEVQWVNRVITDLAQMSISCDLLIDPEQVLYKLAKKKTASLLCTVALATQPSQLLSL